MSKHVLLFSLFRPQFSITHMMGCLNAFTDHSLCKLPPLPLLPLERKARHFLWALLEITVCISSCITQISKLSAFGGSNTKYAMKLIVADLLVPVRKKPLVSSLFCSSQLVLVMGMTGYQLMLGIFDVRREARYRGEPLWHR